MVRCWIVYVIIIIICLAFSGQGERRNKQAIILSTVVMVFFSGLRSWWYGDMVKYYSRFIRESDETLAALYQKNGFRNLGLSILNKITYRAFGIYGYDVLIFIVALFSAITLAMVIERYSFSAYWSYLMYLSMGFYTFTFSGLKQTIAMGFICLAIIELLENRFYKFLVFVALGALFHAPALIFIAAYPFSKKKIDGLYILYVSGIIAVMILFRGRLAYLLEDAYYADASDVASIYLQASYFGDVGGRFIGMVFIMVMAALLRVPNQKDKVYAKVFNIMVIAAAIQTMSIFDNTYTRLADYYYQFIVLFVPMFMQPVMYKEELSYRRVGILGSDPVFYLLIGLVTTIFSVWFFANQIPSVDLYGDILFFWEKNGHLLY